MEDDNSPCTAPMEGCGCVILFGKPILLLNVAKKGVPNANGTTPTEESHNNQTPLRSFGASEGQAGTDHIDEGGIP